MTVFTYNTNKDIKCLPKRFHYCDNFLINVLPFFRNIRQKLVSAVLSEILPYRALQNLIVWHIHKIGTNIAAKRRKLNLSQEQLAELAGVSSNYMARIERGEVKNFSAINLLKIANALKVSIDELISGSYKNKAIKLNPYQQKLFNLLDMLEDSTSEQLSKLFIEIIKTASTTDINNKNDK